MKIIRRYRSEELIGLHVFDFLNDIDQTRAEQRILKSWEKDFHIVIALKTGTKGVPHFVTLEPHPVEGSPQQMRYQLYKEQEADDSTLGGFIFTGELP